MAKSTVFISAYRNVSIRYILYSDIFNELKSRNLRLVLFLKDNDLSYYRQRLDNDNVFIEPILYNEAMKQLRSKLGRFFVIVRKCMSGGRKGYHNLTDKTRLFIYEREASRNFRTRFEFQFIRLLALLGSVSLFIRRSMVMLESYFFPGRMYDQYFKKYEPSLLVVSSVGYMIDPYFMRAAKRHKCRVVSIVHNWDNPTTKDYRGADPDHVISWNSLMKRELNVFHDIGLTKIYVGGIAHWDLYTNGSLKPRSKEAFQRAYGLSKDRKIMLYGTSSPVMFRQTFDVVEHLLESIVAGAFSYPVQLLVRLHPTYLLRQRGKEGRVVDLYRARMTKIERKFGDLVSFNLPVIEVLKDDIDMPIEDIHNLAEILYYSDLLLTEYSTLMIEASIFDVPVINVGLHKFRDTEKSIRYVENFTHIRRILETGATRQAYNYDQLIEFMNRYLEDRNLHKQERERLVDQEITTNRGTAGKSIATYIYRLIQDNRLS